ncbi:hypothetical protein AMS68_007836 [Peltaster fructicola]|uniref:DUF1254 domain-containing protein n=1 Tax=Peltaster fructicola TaxID=286661 RepID=A0A6H0Y655_9PEZI|nr:hypothetical protein AMS68_007836 [Peltaster fructicola]
MLRTLDRTHPEMTSDNILVWVNIDAANKADVQLPHSFALLMLRAIAPSLSNPTMLHHDVQYLDSQHGFRYTYPLTIFANFAGSVLKNHQVNEIFHQRNLATPDDPGVVKPNVDTLYSRVVLDLSSQDVVLTVPEIEAERYWNYPVYDPFGQVVAEIGVVNGNKPGKYLIRRADDVHALPGYENGTHRSEHAFGGEHRWRSWSHGQHAEYQGIVNLPGSYATMLIRLLLISNTTSDLTAVHKIQNATSLATVRRAEVSVAPVLTSTALNGSFLGISSPARQFEFAARLVPYSQPIVRSDTYRVATILARAGLYNGHYHPQAVNLTQAANIANASITADITQHVRDEGDGYQLQTVAYQGFYGSHYSAAAYVALGGYQQQTVKQTLYPGFQGPVFSSFYTLSANGSWLFTFSGKPRVKAPGFWSLSVYGADQYLIKNPLNRFEVGDRTYSLVYEDGTPVYGPAADATKDGPFHILLQPVDVPPPANWTSNWLPAERSFFMLLRWYYPEPAMTNGSYVYPRVQNISQITA